MVLREGSPPLADESAYQRCGPPCPLCNCAWITALTETTDSVLKRLTYGSRLDVQGDTPGVQFEQCRADPLKTPESEYSSKPRVRTACPVPRSRRVPH